MHCSLSFSQTSKDARCETIFIRLASTDNQTHGTCRDIANTFCTTTHLKNSAQATLSALFARELPWLGFSLFSWTEAAQWKRLYKGPRSSSRRGPTVLNISSRRQRQHRRPMTLGEEGANCFRYHCGCF